MERLLSVIDGLSEWSGRIFSFAILMATLVIVIEVAMRYGFGASTGVGFELPIFLAGATYLMSGAYAHLHDAHVRVDLLYSRWSRRGQAIADVITAPIFFMGLVVLLWAGAHWTMAAVEQGTTTGTVWNPPVWPMRLSIPVGCFLLLCQGGARMVRDLRIIFGRSESG